MQIKAKYNDELQKHSIINKLKEIITKDTVIINIGTDRCIGDSVAPMLGTMMKEQKFPLPIYGTLDNPIHAMNIHNKIKDIYEKHPSSNIIGIDACLGDKEDVGKIILRDSPIQAGRGVGKCLPEVGDYSIVAIVDDKDTHTFFTERNIRLSFIRKLAKSINLVLSEVLNINYGRNSGNMNTTANNIGMNQIAISK
ncbi:spore protease YyaC [Clostridium botulinum D/C]|uniref:spore protease YyaC n=1 Tax=Clostridium botulinum TaxID=1491 RepID=UPI001E489E6F|nr:spore protease YyaC [Clostridium botulinum]MCD3319490.1 spore protease YyaC [Clostridium botulinum D/C]MCD3324355.1 spore protease YyaC [Clostridium botulinum D/C]MCD3327356.1 spore protease YyaC [Clostridium botulinum D/C]